MANPHTPPPRSTYTVGGASDGFCLASNSGAKKDSSKGGNIHTPPRGDGGIESERVKVVLRVRPALGNETAAGALELDPDGKAIRLLRPDAPVSTSDYHFDRVLGPESTQHDVYMAGVRDVVEDVLKGYNGTVMAYGQTGTGKTYTLGNVEPTAIGMIPRCVAEIFKQATADPFYNYSVTMSYVQIYMEIINDLLLPESDNLAIREDVQNGVFIAGVREVPVSNLEETLHFLELGDRNRTFAFTAMNAHSSRSHAVVMVTVVKSRKYLTAVERAEVKKAEKDGMVSQKVKVGKLYLVDLAGSERLKKSGSVGLRAHEARSINLSLTTLGMCISARATDERHVPFRDSKLTRLLQESLGGNAKTTLIVCVANARDHVDESLQSLQFASRAMCVKNKPVVNERCDYRVLHAELMGDLDRQVDRAAELQEAMARTQDEKDALQEALEQEKAHFSGIIAALRDEGEQRVAEVTGQLEVTRHAAALASSSGQQRVQQLEEENTTLAEIHYSQVAALNAKYAELAAAHAATAAAHRRDAYAAAQELAATRKLLSQSQAEGGLLRSQRKDLQGELIGLRNAQRTASTSISSLRRMMVAALPPPALRVPGGLSTLSSTPLSTPPRSPPAGLCTPPGPPGAGLFTPPGSPAGGLHTPRSSLPTSFFTPLSSPPSHASPSPRMAPSERDSAVAVPRITLDAVAGLGSVATAPRAGSADGGGAEATDGYGLTFGGHVAPGPARVAAIAEAIREGVLAENSLSRGASGSLLPDETEAAAKAVPEATEDEDGGIDADPSSLAVQRQLTAVTKLMARLARAVSTVTEANVAQASGITTLQADAIVRSLNTAHLSSEVASLKSELQALGTTLMASQHVCDTQYVKVHGLEELLEVREATIAKCEADILALEAAQARLEADLARECAARAAELALHDKLLRQRQELHAQATTLRHQARAALAIQRAYRLWKSAGYRAREAQDGQALGDLRGAKDSAARAAHLQAAQLGSGMVLDSMSVMREAVEALLTTFVGRRKELDLSQRLAERVASAAPLLSQARHNSTVAAFAAVGVCRAPSYTIPQSAASTSILSGGLQSSLRRALERGLRTTSQRNTSGGLLPPQSPDGRPAGGPMALPRSATLAAPLTAVSSPWPEDQHQGHSRTPAMQQGLGSPNGTTPPSRTSSIQPSAAGPSSVTPPARPPVRVATGMASIVAQAGMATGPETHNTSGYMGSERGPGVQARAAGMTSTSAAAAAARLRQPGSPSLGTSAAAGSGSAGSSSLVAAGLSAAAAGPARSGFMAQARTGGAPAVEQRATRLSESVQAQLQDVVETTRPSPPLQARVQIVGPAGTARPRPPTAKAGLQTAPAASAPAGSAPEQERHSPDGARISPGGARRSPGGGIGSGWTGAGLTQKPPATGGQPDGAPEAITTEGGLLGALKRAASSVKRK